MNTNADIGDTYVIQFDRCGVDDDSMKKITDYIRSLGIYYNPCILNNAQILKYNYEQIILGKEQRFRRLAAHGWICKVINNTPWWLIPDKLTLNINNQSKSNEKSTRSST